MKKIIMSGLMGLALLTPSDTSHAQYKGIDPDSPFARECRMYNLDPEQTSSYALYAVKLGLPPNAIPDQILERKYGFAPDKLSKDELDKRIKQLGFEKVQDLYSHLLE